MFINLHGHVLAKLAAREVPWTQVARDTGMSYETLKKIASGRTPNPGVQHVQKLADYFGIGVFVQDVAQAAVAGTSHVHPEPTRAEVGHAQEAIETVAEAQAAIKHVEAVAVAAIRQEAGQATAEIKHVAEELLKDDAPWDGATDRRQAGEPWDGKTERRKLDAPIDRRISPASVARAEFLKVQAANAGNRERMDIGSAGQGV